MSNLDTEKTLRAMKWWLVVAGVGLALIIIGTIGKLLS